LIKRSENGRSLKNLTSGKWIWGSIERGNKSIKRLRGGAKLSKGEISESRAGIITIRGPREDGATRRSGEAVGRVFHVVKASRAVEVAGITAISRGLVTSMGISVGLIQPH